MNTLSGDSASSLGLGSAPAPPKCPLWKWPRYCLGTAGGFVKMEGQEEQSKGRLRAGGPCQSSNGLPSAQQPTEFHPVPDERNLQMRMGKQRTVTSLNLRPALCVLVSSSTTWPDLMASTYAGCSLPRKSGWVCWLVVSEKGSQLCSSGWPERSQTNPKR